MINGARGSVIGWDIMLQAGRSRARFPIKSLDFSIDPFFLTSTACCKDSFTFIYLTKSPSLLLTYWIINSVANDWFWFCNSQVLRKFGTFLKNRTLIIMLTQVNHWIVSWASSIQSSIPVWFLENVFIASFRHTFRQHLYASLIWSALHVPLVPPSMTIWSSCYHTNPVYRLRISSLYTR
jgi:hypothetical protein